MSDVDFVGVKGVYKNCRGIWAAQWTDEKGQRHTKYFNPKFFPNEATAKLEAYKFKVHIQKEVDRKGGVARRRNTTAKRAATTVYGTNKNETTIRKKRRTNLTPIISQPLYSPYAYYSMQNSNLIQQVEQPFNWYSALDHNQQKFNNDQNMFAHLYDDSINYSKPIDYSNYNSFIFDMNNQRDNLYNIDNKYDHDPPRQALSFSNINEQYIQDQQYWSYYYDTFSMQNYQDKNQPNYSQEELNLCSNDNV